MGHIVTELDAVVSRAICALVDQPMRTFALSIMAVGIVVIGSLLLWTTPNA